MKLYLSVLDELRDWTRNRLPKLNLAAESGDELAVNAIVSDGVRMARTVLSQDCPLSIEYFNYFAMAYSSLTRHQKRRQALAGVSQIEPEVPGDSEFRPVVTLIVETASKLGIECRFLAAPYLFENPYVRGRLAQFLPHESETVFIEYNMVGTRAYERASHAVLDAWDVGIADPEFGLLMRQAHDALEFVNKTNVALWHRLNIDQFKIFREYYCPVRMPGMDEDLEGVNAGDQPWPFILDIVLGLAADGSRRTKAIEKQKYLLPQDRVLLTEVLEKERMEIIPSILGPRNQTASPEALASLLAAHGTTVISNALDLCSVIKAHAKASHAHWALVEKFIIQPSGQGEDALGSTGLPVKLLKGLIDMRNNSPNVSLLRNALRFLGRSPE